MQNKPNSRPARSRPSKAGDAGSRHADKVRPSGLDSSKCQATGRYVAGGCRPGVQEDRVAGDAVVKNLPSARQLVRQDGWQAAIFGGRNRPSLLLVAHQLANAFEVTSS